jgi:hypothetical protein
MMLGTTGLVVLYGVHTFSCLVFPQMLIRYMGCKFTLMFGQALAIFYIAFQAFPKWYTIIPCELI